MSNRKYRKFIFIPLLLGAFFSNAQTKDSVNVPVKDSLTAKKQEVAEVKYPQFQFKGLFGTLSGRNDKGCRCKRSAS